MSSLIVEKVIDPRACGHVEMEQLGNEGGAIFHLCVACGSIIIAQAAHRWIIRPTDEMGPLPF